MHKVFISYHHRNDQWYKSELVKCGESIFVDRSVDTGAIPDEWSDEQIRREIPRQVSQGFYGDYCPSRDRDEATKTRRLGDLFEHVRRICQQAIGHSRH